MTVQPRTSFDAVHESAPGTNRTWRRLPFGPLSAEKSGRQPNDSDPVAIYEDTPLRVIRFMVS